MFIGLLKPQRRGNIVVFLVDLQQSVPKLRLFKNILVTKGSYIRGRKKKRKRKNRRFLFEFDFLYDSQLLYDLFYYEKCFSKVCLPCTVVTPRLPTVLVLGRPFNHRSSRFYGLTHKSRKTSRDGIERKILIGLFGRPRLANEGVSHLKVSTSKSNSF